MPSETVKLDEKCSQSIREQPPAIRHVVSAATRAVSPQNILVSLIAFRILNALSIKTFFQPDEYFQSLEPAWEMTFGGDSGTWITWEWRHHLRSSIHPALFAGIYAITSYFANLFHLSSHMRAELLIAAPKVQQAVIAAYGDYYTWRMAEQVYGRGSQAAWAATTWTVVALYFWPWAWLLEGVKTLIFWEVSGLRWIYPTIGLRIENDEAHVQGMLKELTSLTLAAIACVLRPTNLLIWLSFAGFAILCGTPRTTYILIRQALLCGSLVLVLSSFVDRVFYQAWTFPPLRFLYFNLAQALAVLYGKNHWHYYYSQGFPLLLTTALPFVIVGFWQALRPLSRPELRGVNHSTKAIRFQLAITALFVPLILSFISHKEVRFIYPLLPVVHVLAAKPVAQYFTSPASLKKSGLDLQLRRTPLLVALLAINIVIAWYTATIHQSGVISVMDHLRYTYEQQNSLHRNMTVGFLMPCHSTPWRSHLVYPNIHAWALGCEPPVNLNTSERASYVDEADRFYANPLLFMRTEMEAPLQRHRSSARGSAQFLERESSEISRKQWPDYLIFFQQLEETLTLLLQGSGYKESWRVFNSHWHDDWRRKGDVIVWRLDVSDQRSGRGQRIGR
ncbi:MAG: hypothetical protein M1836_007000 [Candelina mexicana]|nr:MAG: hypothetical protein M1836_007000 [Candelina mexicana]